MQRLVKRCNRKAHIRRHTAGIVIGIVVMLAGSELGECAVNAVVECMATTVHAIGVIPILRHAEPLWDLLLEDET